MPTKYGYQYGQPFGDPSGFNRSTGEDEINRFNQWMRGQDWYTGLRGGMGNGDLSKDQRRSLTDAMNRAGIPLPKDFIIDQGGNLNQKSRTGRNLKIAGAVGGAALGGLGLAGIGPLGFLGGAGTSATTLTPTTLSGSGLAGAGAGGASTLLPSTILTPTAGMLPAGGTGIGGSMGLGSVLKGVGKAVIGGGGKSSDGLSLGKILGLSGIGTGMDVLGGLLDRKLNKTSFKGARGSNGVSVDPTEVYSQGIGGLQGMQGFLKDRAMNPVKLRSLNDAAGGDFEDARALFQRLGM